MRKILVLAVMLCLVGTAAQACHHNKRKSACTTACDVAIVAVPATSCYSASSCYSGSSCYSAAYVAAPRVTLRERIAARRAASCYSGSSCYSSVYIAPAPIVEVCPAPIVTTTVTTITRSGPYTCAGCDEPCAKKADGLCPDCRKYK